MGSPHGRNCRWKERERNKCYSTEEPRNAYCSCTAHWGAFGWAMSHSQERNTLHAMWPSSGWEKCILTRMLKAVVFEGVNEIRLAHWRVLVNTIMRLVSHKRLEIRWLTEQLLASRILLIEYSVNRRQNLPTELRVYKVMDLTLLN
jgi:hypothetical protein